VIVDYFNVSWPSLRPLETDPILIVDTDAVLSLSISSQCLEHVARWDPEIVQAFRLVDRVQSPGGYTPENLRQSLSSSLCVLAVE